MVEGEKVLPVLSRNIEVAITEKAKASQSYLILKKALINDHSIPQVKEEFKDIALNMECEDVPNEHTLASKNDSTPHYQIESQDE